MDDAVGGEDGGAKDGGGATGDAECAFGQGVVVKDFERELELICDFLQKAFVQVGAFVLAEGLQKRGADPTSLAG